MSKRKLRSVGFLPISDDEEKAINCGIAQDPDTLVLTDALLARLRPRYAVLAEQQRNGQVAMHAGALPV